MQQENERQGLQLDFRYLEEQPEELFLPSAQRQKLSLQSLLQETGPAS